MPSQRHDVMPQARHARITSCCVHATPAVCMGQRPGYADDASPRTGAYLRLLCCATKAAEPHRRGLGTIRVRQHCRAACSCLLLPLSSTAAAITNQLRAAEWRQYEWLLGGAIAA